MVKDNTIQFNEKVLVSKQMSNWARWCQNFRKRAQPRTYKIQCRCLLTYVDFSVNTFHNILKCEPWPKGSLEYVIKYTQFVRNY